MNRNEFLDKIYNNIKIGMKVIKPRKISEIVDIKPSGDIYYLVGTSNSKAVTKKELCAIYDELESGGLTTQKIYEIATKSKPCNVTTIKWVLKEFDLANEGFDKVWRKTWQ